MQTVEHNFGVPVHHYVRVDFEGFRAVVDAVGGIDVVVEEPIVDNAYPTEDYGTMRIEIPAGPQHMDGETALRYARSRHGSSDFDRAKRQQQILTALARRLLAPEVWPELPAVYRVMMDNVDTDLTIDDLLLLAPTLYRVGPDGIEHHVIGREMTESWTTPTGGAVLLPRWEAISPLVQELFTP
jgi:anionic cell wall polymer biosynthesis LytR-Cps2A-Psr (LCP) family protein